MYTTGSYLLSFLTYYDYFLRVAHENKTDLVNVVRSLRGTYGPKLLRIKVTPLMFQTRFYLNASVVEHVNELYNHITDTWLALNTSVN